MSNIRVNRDTGLVEKQNFGIFGTSWTDVNEGTPTRVDPDTGKVQTQSFGIFGSTWNDVGGNGGKEVRVNTSTGQLESNTGLFGTWVIDDEYNDDD